MGKYRKPNNDNAFWESAISNMELYNHYFDRLKELALSRFEWKNVPPSIDVRYIEECLFSRGKIVFFKDEDMDEYLMLPVSNQSTLGVYHNPLKFRAFADNGYNKELDASNGVIIYNNYLRKPCVNDIKVFARELWETDSALRVNILAQKTPILIQCDDTQKLTMENAYKEFIGNAPVIYGTKGTDFKDIKSISTGAPYVADKLYDHKTQVWNEALTYLGINNINIVKKERLISDEVVRSSGGVIASRYSPLIMRQEACKQINKMFGLNMSVDYRKDWSELVEAQVENSTTEEVEREGGVNNEQVHN